MSGDQRRKINPEKVSGSSKSVRRGPGRPAYADVLTPAEWRVVHAAQHGLSNKAIADRLGISTDGVKYHMANALAKLQLPNKAALKSWFKSPRASVLAESMKNEPTAATGTGAGLDKIEQATLQGEVMSEEKSQPVQVQGLGQVARTVRSLEQSMEFYKNKLGIPHLYSFGNLAFFDLGGSRLFLNEAEELNEAESLLYFKVADIKKACDQLSEAGVEISNQPHLIHTHEDGTEEWMAFLKDPEGRPLGLMSSVSAAA